MLCIFLCASWSRGIPKLWMLLGKSSPHNRPPRANRGSRGIPLLILDLNARRGWVVSTTSRPFYPRERPGIHCIGGWVRLQSRYGRIRKISPPPGFDPRTVQPLASRYTDWAITTHNLIVYWLNVFLTKLTCLLLSNATNYISLSIHATCFGSTDHLQALKYTILRFKIKCIYILFVWDFTNCTRNNNLYIAIKLWAFYIFCVLFLYCMPYCFVQ
jgi:hypothetical protein